MGTELENLCSFNCRHFYPSCLLYFFCSPAADQSHDLDAITISQDRITVLRARNNFEVHLDRYMRLRDTQLAQQVRYSAASGNFAGLSIDLDGHPLNSLLGNGHLLIADESSAKLLHVERFEFA